MVQTISHQFNTHVKRLSLSASVVIIIITHLLDTLQVGERLKSFTRRKTMPLRAMSTWTDVP